MFNKPTFIYRIIAQSTGVITAVLVFSSGVGRYRFLILFALYSLSKILLSTTNAKRSLSAIVLPVYGIAFYLDAVNGPIIPIYSKNNLAVAILVTIIASDIVKKIINRTLSSVTAGQFFVVCPACQYNNTHLVEKCLNCSHEKGRQIVTTKANISPDIKGHKIPERLLNLLNTGEDEAILFYKKIKPDVAILKNGVKQARKYFIITTKNVIFLDYGNFHIRIPSSWRERVVIPLADINAVEGRMKARWMSKTPFLILRTRNNDIYEIVFSHFEKYQEGINEIAALIKRTNPQVEMKIELTGA